MLNMKFTRVFFTENREVVSGIKIDEEGMAMVYEKEGNITRVRPSTGVEGELFAGVSMSRNTPPLIFPEVDEFVIPDDLAVTLRRVPMAGQILVRVNNTLRDISTAEPVSDAEVQVDGDTLRFFTGEEGKSVYVQYMFEPTITEARTFTGDNPYGNLSVSSLSAIGLIVRGDICTNYFDASVDWSTALQVKLGPDGRFTTEGPGEVIPNITILNSPNTGNPMLVLRLAH